MSLTCRTDVFNLVSPAVCQRAVTLPFVLSLEALVVPAASSPLPKHSFGSLCQLGACRGLMSLGEHALPVLKQWLILGGRLGAVSAQAKAVCAERLCAVILSALIFLNTWLQATEK